MFNDIFVLDPISQKENVYSSSQLTAYVNPITITHPAGYAITYSPFSAVLAFVPYFAVLFGIPCILYHVSCVVVG